MFHQHQCLETIWCFHCMLLKQNAINGINYKEWRFLADISGGWEVQGPEDLHLVRAFLLCCTTAQDRRTEGREREGGWMHPFVINPPHL